MSGGTGGGPSTPGRLRRRELRDRTVARARRLLRTYVYRPGPLERLEEATLLDNLVTRYAVGVVVTLGIPDLIASNVHEVGELAARTGADPDALARVGRHLARQGIFADDGTGGFSLTDAGELLRREHPESRALQFHLDGSVARLEAAVSGMLHSVRTGRPSFAEVNKAELWEQVAAEPLVAASFDAEMARHASQLAPSLVARYDWSGVSRLVDVGGGTGELLLAVLAAIPAMRGTLVEYAAAAERARRRVAAAEAEARCEVVQADFLDVVPAGADAYLLSWILHDWDDRHAELILSRCAEAAGRSGRVLVVEQPHDVTPNTDLDLRMLVYFGGRERTRREYEALAGRAGLRAVSWVPLDRGFWLADLRAR